MRYRGISSFSLSSCSLLENPQAASLEGPKVSPAAIVGPIVAAMIGIIVILAGAYFLRRRRAKEQLVNAIPDPYVNPSAPIEATLTAYAANADAAEKGQEIVVVVSPSAESALAIHAYHNELTTVDSDAASLEERTWYNPHSPTLPQTFSQTEAQLSHPTSNQSQHTRTAAGASTQSVNANHIIKLTAQGINQLSPVPHEVSPRCSR